LIIDFLNSNSTKLTTMTDSASPIAPITLPDLQHPEKEEAWLRDSLRTWLDEEFLPEIVNDKIAERAAKIFVRQRMEGENDLGSLVIAIIAEMRAFDFSRSFYSEFAVANAVSDLILDSLGIDRCCGA
jgi:hypothetical protein